MAGTIEVSSTGLYLENILFTLAVAGYLAATAGYLAFLCGRKGLGLYASRMLRLAFFLHSAFLITRTVNVQRVPFVGHFEFGNMFIWACILVYLWTEWRLQDSYYAVGAFLTSLIVLYIGYLTVVPKIFPKVTISRAHSLLPPVLQSNWLKVHVSASVLGYAGFTLAFAVALMWLLKARLQEGSAFECALPNFAVLEEYMYRASVFGFLFQTVMIITGAIWADTSWGRYWGWDPKEMWALITWFVFAVYLHARFTRDWSGLRTVVLVVAGWFAMLFTWVGVAWLLAGIHSFG
ncbi:MAG TPA: c-type cytochrome biogenesis protein CcsB [Firmicutes bacterium]|nr:c-type cytochrome biogenesis protein CcsB [Bacillota bacterium]